MSFVAAAVGIGGALISGRGADKAADRQARASDAATEEQRRQYDLYREDQAPYRQIGGAALNQLAALYGITPYAPPGADQQPMSYEDWSQQHPFDPGDNPFAASSNQAQHQQAYQSYVDNFEAPPVTPGAPGAPDYSAFYNSPDYAFGLEQGNQSLQRAAAAGGSLASGNTLAAAQRYGQGYATQRFGDYRNSLASLAGIGQSATNATGQAGLLTGQGVADSLVGGGAARASGIAGQYNGIADAVGIAGNAFGDWWRNRQTTQPVRRGPMGPL